MFEEEVCRRRRTDVVRAVVVHGRDLARIALRAAPEAGRHRRAHVQARARRRRGPVVELAKNKVPLQMFPDVPILEGDFV